MIPFAVIIYTFHPESLLAGHADYYFFAGTLVLAYSTFPPYGLNVCDLSGHII